MTGPADDGTGHLGDLASALVDGQLAAAEEERALAHVAGCPACASELAATARVRDLVRALGPVEPRRPLLALPALASRPSRAAGLVAAAAASVALLVLSGVEQERRGVPQVAQLVQVHSTSPVNIDPMSQLAPAVIPVSLER